MKKTQKVLDILAFIEAQDINTDEAQRLISEIENNNYREEEGEEVQDMYDRVQAQDGNY